MAQTSAYFNWSSGKDSALALYRAIRSEQYSIQTLFSVLQRDSRTVAMHEVGIALLERQAEAIGIPLTPFYFDPGWTAETYGQAISVHMRRFKARRITTALFGDLHLASLRKAREESCARAGMSCAFPLWGTPPEDVLAEFVQLGFRAIVTCVDCAALPETFLGRIIDNDFLHDLPQGADLCGENGEYHSFVFDGPIFRHPVAYRVRQRYSRTFIDGRTHAPHRYAYLALS